MRCSCCFLFWHSLDPCRSRSRRVRRSNRLLQLSRYRLRSKRHGKGRKRTGNFKKPTTAMLFSALWDERFVGWPRRTSVPVDKDKMREDLKRAPDRKVLDYKLEALSVREYGGNVVITLYRATVHSTDNNGKDEQTRPYRLTHTWMKTGQAWQIIGGMPSADNSN